MIPRILSALVGLLHGTPSNDLNIQSWRGSSESWNGTTRRNRSQYPNRRIFFVFLHITVFCFLGAYLKQAQWLIAAAIVLGSAALFRSLAWISHDADFATDFIVIEVVMTVLLIASAYLFNKSQDEATESPS